MVEGIAIVCLGAVGLGVLLCVHRAILGPTLFDRVLAFDCIALEFVAAVLLLSIVFQSEQFMDVVLAVALLGFLSTISLAAWLEGTLVD